MQTVQASRDFHLDNPDISQSKCLTKLRLKPTRE
jgi:hypothetical protein